MKLPIELISTDFDGTLYAEFESPPVPLALQQLLAALQKRGVWWVINTGRNLTDLMEAMARARLSVRPDYLVLVEREIYAHEGARYVPLDDWNHACARDHARLFERVRSDVPRLTRWINLHFQADVYEDPWSPLCLIARSPSDADAITAYLNEYCQEVPSLVLMRNDVYARLSHAAYDKGTALSEIARRLAVPAEKIFAAGDHLNDLPMLVRERAAHLMAPSNAVPEVQALVLRQGGCVSPRPHGHGVLRELRHMLRRRTETAFRASATSAP
ncbi:MAG: hypothetical protein FJ387_00410 [Verrucomicrobia bacterium]|nr:hypothetical protein [Verrucomicrobiota bacterium]